MAREDGSRRADCARICGRVRPCVLQSAVTSPHLAVVAPHQCVAEHTDTKFFVDNLKVEVLARLRRHFSQLLNTFSTAMPRACEDFCLTRLSAGDSELSRFLPTQTSHEHSTGERGGEEGRLGGEEESRVRCVVCESGYLLSEPTVVRGIEEGRFPNGCPSSVSRAIRSA